jgi:hypothetical protein
VAVIDRLQLGLPRLQSSLDGHMLWRIDMKARSQGPPHRIELGRYIVADPVIGHGKPTYKGTRVMVWQDLAMLERGESSH